VRIQVLSPSARAVVRGDVGSELFASESAAVRNSSPLTTFGVDSLMAAELRKQIEHDLAIVVPAVEFLDGPSVAALADWLGSTLSSGAPWKPKTTVPADLLVTAPNRGHEASALAGERWIDLLTQVPHVSDDDVDALLREVLQAEGDSDDWNSRPGS